MAISNRLAVQYNHENINREYDFFLLATCEKFIPFGAKCLDVPDGIQFESIAFENGKTLYIMIKKGTITKSELNEKINDGKLSIKKLLSTEIPVYILFRLFLYSLNNFESNKLSFNNLTGKFYIYNPVWMEKDRKSFMAIGINVDSNLNVILEVATFARLSLFRDNDKIKKYPKYIFSNKNNALKRVFNESFQDEVYIKKGIYNKKAEIPFLLLSQIDKQKSKVFYLYYVLDLLLNRYREYIDFYFYTMDIKMSIGIERDKDFMIRANKEFILQKINLVNFVRESEFAMEFNDLVNSIRKITSLCTVNDKMDMGKSNIVLIHNKEYYEHLKYPDPYCSFNRNTITQCITVEDSADKIIDDNKAIVNTIIKEMVIKNDIINIKRISLDDWSDYHFSSDWVFGKEKDGKHYFIVIHPDGSFNLYNKTNDFSSFDIDILNECSDYLTDNKGKEKIIIASNDSNINIISRTNRFALPDKAIFDLDFISRCKESRKKYFAGVVDINFYEDDEGSFYSAGMKGTGMQTNIIRAAHLYKVDTIKGKNIMPEILKTLSVTFVKYKSFTVLPYPIKYLNEYILMVESFQNE